MLQHNIPRFVMLKHNLPTGVASYIPLLGHHHIFQLLRRVGQHLVAGAGN